MRTNDERFHLILKDKKLFSEAKNFLIICDFNRKLCGKKKLLSEIELRISRSQHGALVSERK